MLNYIWFGMMLIAVVVGIFTGNIDAVTEAAINMAKAAVEIAIGLIGIMALWLGTMKIAEESGLIRIIAKALRPITIRLFPDVPEALENTVKISELVSHNIKMVIYANQTLRTAHMAMKELLQKMIKAESISEFDEEMSTMQQIFELQEMYNLKNKEKEIEEELKKLGYIS